MKSELVIFAILAMVVSSFLNAENSTRINDQLASTKLRIENFSQDYAKAKNIEIVTAKTSITKDVKG